MVDDLVRSALAVLDRNRRGDWTCPAAGIYPHQWMWDSGFVAIGLARDDPARAAAELLALLRGQWSNGMVPHMVFADDVPDAGSRRLWGSRRDPARTRTVATSAITQPPVLAIAARRVADHLAADARPAFLAAIVPKLLAHHEWLYRERDPRRTGLVTLIHPWECGLDTTPPWMEALRRLRPSIGVRLVLALRLTGLARALRRDTRYLPARERASNDDGLRMLDLAYRARRHDFVLTRLRPDRSLQIQDLSFNALLAIANRDLISLASDVGVGIAPDLRERFDATPDALETLWSDELGTYCSRDAITGHALTPPTIAAFTMLGAGAHDERLAGLVEQLRVAPWWPAHPVPSIATDAPDFDADRYWSGPTWVNTNWLIVEGLRRRGEPALADELRRRTVELVTDRGCAEYFSPLSGEPLGAPEFSWTAALAIDLAGSPAGG